MKRVISILLMAALLFTGISFTPAASYAASKPDDWAFTGADCTSSSVAAATIDYIQARYPNGTQYKGSGECYGWAEKISTMLASKRSTKYYKSLAFTEKNFLAKCKGVKAGTHLRVSNEKSFNGYSGHSIVLLKVTKDEVCWTEANVGGYNNIRHAKASPAAFINYYGFSYINAVTKTTSYKLQKEPLMTIKRSSQGSGTLYWTKTSNTSKYKVYRATSKNGKYKLIRTTTKCNYTDTKAALGKKYYYKVKAQKKSGSSKYSDKKSFTAKLAAPVLTNFTNENAKGYIQLSWDPVNKADKYYIYRTTSDDSKEKFKYVGATSKTTYTDKKATDPHAWYVYKIRAVYTKNSNGNSKQSIPYGYFDCRLPAPEITCSYDAATHALLVSWDKIKYADGYALYYDDMTYGYSSSYGYTTECSQTVDLSWFEPGNAYKFYVKAYESRYDYEWNRTGSVAGNVIEFTVPDNPNASQNPDYEYEYWF